MKTRIMPVIFAYFVVAMLLASSAFAGTGLRHFRVIWQENPAFEASISWTHDKLDAGSIVYFDEEEHGTNIGSYAHQQKVTYSKKYSAGRSYSYHARLTQLKPSTVYYFTIVSGGSQSPVLSFETAPIDPSETFSLLFGGDSRTDQVQRIAMNGRMGALLQENAKILALVHGGDYVENGASWPLWEDWLDDHQNIRTDSGRVLPIVPGRGNHEIDAKLFNEIFNFPGKGNVYFVTTIADLAVVTLNTEISTSGEQKVWLDKTLSSLSKTARWITANYHRPAYPATKLASDALQHWVPLFEKYLVNMVFESDGHTLKKTVPIRNNRRDDRHGVVYVGEGGLGVKQREPKNADAWYLQSPGYATAAHHVQQLTITPSEMKFEVILLDGRLFDSMKMHSRLQLKMSTTPAAGQPVRLYNHLLDRCLNFSTSNREDIAVHAPCNETWQANGDDLFVVEKITDSELYRIRHKASDTCLTFTTEWLFMNRHKVMLLTCQESNDLQTLQIKKANFVDWQITNPDGERCLHLGSLFQNSDKMPQSYHVECGDLEGKENFQFVTEGVFTQSK